MDSIPSVSEVLAACLRGPLTAPTRAAFASAAANGKEL